jgi:hypothetical protein
MPRELKFKLVFVQGDGSAKDGETFTVPFDDDSKGFAVLDVYLQADHPTFQVLTISDDAASKKWIRGAADPTNELKEGTIYKVTCE